jgi:hypothetical protein
MGNGIAGVPAVGFNIELFASPTANASGYGEGQTPLTLVPYFVNTNANGDGVNPQNHTGTFT